MTDTPTEPGWHDDHDSELADIAWYDDTDDTTGDPLDLPRPDPTATTPRWEHLTDDTDHQHWLDARHHAEETLAGNTDAAWAQQGRDRTAVLAERRARQVADQADPARHRGDGEGDIPDHTPRHAHTDQLEPDSQPNRGQDTPATPTPATTETPIAGNTPEAEQQRKQQDTPNPTWAPIDNLFADPRPEPDDQPTQEFAIGRAPTPAQPHTTPDDPTTHPSPTPPPGEPSRRPGTTGLGTQVREVVVALWVRGPGRLAPVAWWLTRTVRATPWLWGAVTALLVVVTRVRVDHIAILMGIVAALTFGPQNGGAVIRRERITSLRAVGTYRKRRRLVHRRWNVMWANAGLVRAPLSPGGAKRLPQLKKVRPHRDGVTAYVHGEKVAVGTSEVLAAARPLIVTSGAKSLRVTQPETGRALLPFTLRTPLSGVVAGGGVDPAAGEGGAGWGLDFRGWSNTGVEDPIAAAAPRINRGHLLAITFKFQDPFPRRKIRLSELPAPSGPGKVVIGLTEEHEALEKSLFLPSLLVGAPGSGKSSEVWTTLEALLTAGIPFRLRVFDPKGGLELGDLKEAAFRYESVPSRWPRFLEQACEALRVRQEIMARKGMRKVPAPTEEFPLDLMLIDELVTVLAMSRGQEARVRVFGQEMSAKEAFVVYLSQIRASLGSCIALSQLGEKQVLGPARGMFPYISCLRVGPTEKELVDILLGQGAHNAYPAHLLDPQDEHMQGRGWVRTKGGIIAYRAAFMENEDRARTAERIAVQTQRYRKNGQQDPEPAERVRAPRKTARPRREPSATAAVKAARTAESGPKRAPTKTARKTATGTAGGE